MTLGASSGDNVAGVPLSITGRAEHPMAMPARSYPKRWTAYEVRALMEASPTHWPRYEVIDGELLVTPAPRLVHQWSLELLRDLLKPYIARHLLGQVFGSPADLELEKNTIVQPDLFVVPASFRPPREWKDVTAVLLAIEVLSPSSAKHDRFTKRRFFERARVPEYWAIDLDERIVQRWRPDADEPELLVRELVWQPIGVTAPLVVDLGRFFDDVHRD